jgi:hypothetical protein
MSAFPQGLISFPGLTTFKSAEYTASQGIAPGICNLEIPQELVGGLAAEGDLTFSYGDQSFTLYSCVVDLGNTDRNGGGYVARVQIYDRRWAWKFGAISGHYNLPAPGTPTAGGIDTGYSNSPSSTPVRADTLQTPQQLASLCLDAMGEEEYDVSALPNTTTPEIHWSYENPAQALESLCESLGCRVVHDIASDGVRIVVIGEGADLPDGPMQWISQPVAPSQSPSSLQFVGGQTVQQGFILLNAVGLDTSGAIVPIDQLSYTPPNGWKSEPLAFPSVATEPAHTYAEQSVYRWWQPVVPYTAPDGTKISDLKQFIFFDRQLDTNLNPTDPNGATTQRPEILGNFDACYCQADTPDTVLTYHGSIEVDQNRCLFITSDALVDAEQGNVYSAELWLKTSFAVRDATTREPAHFTQSLNLNDSQGLTEPRIVRHDEIVRQVVGVYSDLDGISFVSSTDNSNTVGQAASDYLTAVAQEYEAPESLDVPYVGLVPIQVDGAIRQVTYTIQSGEGGKTVTRASLNTEHSHYIPRYENRRDKVVNKAAVTRTDSQKALTSQQQQNEGQPSVR